MSREPTTKSRIAFAATNTTVMVLLCLTILLPLWMVVVTSLSSDSVAIAEGYVMFPRGSLDFSNYLKIANSVYLTSFFNSLIVVSMGTLFGMTMILMAGYALGHQNLFGRKLVIYMIIGALIFDGGIIPFYLVVKHLGLIDTWWAIVIPVGINHFILILMKNYMTSIPASLEESATIDGAGYFTILVRIIIPVATPIIAACVLFYVVNFWNRYFEVIMFINDPDLYTIQVYLRQLLFEADSQITGTEGLYNNFKMAVMILGMLPILILYPFIQKKFVKGIMLGSIKG